MKSRQRLALTLAALFLSFLLSGSLFAQDQGSYPNQSGIPNQGGDPNQSAIPNQGGNPANDPPARVARIQYISGQVSMQPGGVNDWVAANLNRPLTTSDRVWADKDSRVELNVGNAFVRLNSETSLTLTNVSDNGIQLQLDQGTLELTVQHLEPGEIFEIDTPNLAFTVTKSGVYRIDVPPNDNETWVTVRKGQGQATGQGPAVKVSSGSQVRFTGQGSLQNTAYAAPTPDGFDDWARVRDKRLDGSQSARYVAPGVIGYQDLDYYGTWRVVPPYGAVWVPSSVPVGWAPYRYGHWVWVDPWGWTWVDDAPWGFAPFHYGRWVSYGGVWGWAPGPVYARWRPYYAPALVGWVGGAGWGIGVSFGFGWGGGCGWFALGWGEPYYPWYHGYRGGYVSNTYIKNVNVTNTTINNITNVTNNYHNNTINNTHYANRMVPGAVTAAPKSALINGQNIAKVGAVVPTSELNKGQVLRSANVTPTAQSTLGGHAPLTSGIPPKSATARPVITGNEPTAKSANVASEGHNNPQAPASSSVHNPTTEAASQVHNVPRPAEPAAATNTPATRPYQGQNANQHPVPKPPYAGGPAPASTASNQHANTPNATPVHTTAPVHEPSHNSQPAKSGQEKENKSKESSKSNPGMADSNVPRPPGTYSYHPAPASSAPSYAAGSSYSGGSRSYSPAPSAAPYATNRSGYTAPGTPYRPVGTYRPAPTYTAHVSAPPAPHYSAPSSAGGGRPSGGGGGSHASSSGGHSGGHGR